jgi:hypothetical protein
MSAFIKTLRNYLLEFNVADRADPAFYDYVTILVQQLKKRGFVGGFESFDVRQQVQRAIRNEFINIIDPLSDFSYKISFLFTDSTADVSNMSVKLTDLIDTSKPPKVIDNTHEETSIDEICTYLEQQKTEVKQQQDNPALSTSDVAPLTPGVPDVSANPNQEQQLKQTGTTASYLPQPRR